tara:strand:- start:426 stop:689 length:264 start_codon:yes stop_codon:yes gene_type:complete
MKQKKIYRLTGLDSAMEMLRPGAKYEISSSDKGLIFTRWEDDRTKPSMEEVANVQKLAKEFENKVNTVWKEEDFNKLNKITDVLNTI